jgi:hypothetical protein
MLLHHLHAGGSCCCWLLLVAAAVGGEIKSLHIIVMGYCRVLGLIKQRTAFNISEYSSILPRRQYVKGF